MTTIKNQILVALIDGQRLTVLNMLIRFHTTAGQQRVNELTRDGYPIRRDWKILYRGKRVMEYWIENPHEEIAMLRRQAA